MNQAGRHDKKKSRERNEKRECARLSFRIAGDSLIFFFFHCSVNYNCGVARNKQAYGKIGREREKKRDENINLIRSFKKFKTH